METTANLALRELREALGLGVQEFADSVGLSRVFVWEVERGTKDLGRSAVLKVADVYKREMVQVGVTVEDLLRGGRIGAASPGPAGESAA